jgi:hypothetical protein
MGRLGKDRNPRDCRQSIASAKYRPSETFRRTNTRRHALRQLQGPACHLAQGRNGLDADHTGTWRGLRRRYCVAADPYDTHNNIIPGAPFCVSCATASLATDRPLPMETQAYLAGLAQVVDGNAPVSGSGP